MTSKELLNERLKTLENGGMFDYKHNDKTYSIFRYQFDDDYYVSYCGSVGETFPSVEAVIEYIYVEDEKGMTIDQGIEQMKINRKEMERTGKNNDKH